MTSFNSSSLLLRLVILSSLKVLFFQKPEEYLLDNMARMRDIELLTKMEFFVDRNFWLGKEAVLLRTLLPKPINIK